MTELTWDAVLTTHKRHGTAALPPLFADLSEAERRTLVPELKEVLRGVRGSWGESSRTAPLRVAAAACVGGAAGVSQWLARRDLSWDDTAAAHDDVAAVLMQRRPDWIPDIVERLARRLTADAWPSAWKLVDRLARAADLPAPTHEQYVVGWFASHTRHDGGSLTGSLRADPYSPELILRIFDAELLGRRIDDNHRWSEHRPEWDWSRALRELSDSGFVERGAVLDAVLARMLRGVASVADVRGFLRVYQALDVTDDELAARTTTLLRILPDAQSTAAALAQAELRRLDEAGRLSGEQAAEASRAVLFRPEKKLVKAQFTWLDKAVKRHPDHAGDLLAAAATAFTHSAADLHDRALKSLARHLPKLPESQAMTARAELRAALDLLTGPARTEAAALLGDETAPPEPVEAPALPAFVPPEMPPEIASLDELVEELAALLSNARRTMWSGAAEPADPGTVERLVTALLRASARDRRALAQALEPLDERNGPREHGVSDGMFPADVGTAVWVLYRAARGQGNARGWFRSLFGGRDGGDGGGATGRGRRVPIRGPQRLLMARLCEVAERLRAPAHGPYLARPVTSSGFVDPAELVHGLHQWEAAGRTPWSRDLDQALLRLPASVDPATLARARALTSPQGVRAAQVMAAGGLPAPRVFLADRSWTSWAGGTQLRSTCPMPGVGAAPDGFSDLAAYTALCRGEPVHWDGFESHGGADIACWPLLAPGHRDVIGAHIALPLLCARDETTGRAADALLRLAEADGPVGPVGPGLTQALALGCAARDSGDRLKAADAIVTLASRPDTVWDLPGLGTRMAELVAARVLLTNRLVDCLGNAARAGAYAAVWGVMPGLLPGLLAGERRTGLGDVLALAAESAARIGARGTVVGLDAYATAKGTARATVEARRLDAVLTG